MSIKVAGIVLAAGSSSRMGERNKLCEIWQGKPLVRHVVDAASNSKLASIIVVTGHEENRVQSCLPPETTQIHNSDYVLGMSSSLLKGLSQVSEFSGALILLGDMPLITTVHIDDMMTQFCAGGNDSIVVATNMGKQGNPVLIGKHHYPALRNLAGDRGAKSYISQHFDSVTTVEIGSAAARDFDTPEAFQS